MQSNDDNSQGLGTRNPKPNFKDEQLNKAESKKELEEKVRKRVACEEKAFRIVTRLVEEKAVTKDFLYDACQFMTPSHYADVVEERSIAKQCGYPLCDMTLAKVSAQKYHISTKTNRVFDITDRKKFCSNQCYKASTYFQRQISSTHVWTRETEPRIKFQFLDDNSGSVGEEVILPPTEVKEEIEYLKKLDKLGAAKERRKGRELPASSEDIGETGSDISFETSKFSEMKLKDDHFEECESKSSDNVSNSEIQPGCNLESVSNNTDKVTDYEKSRQEEAAEDVTSQRTTGNGDSLLVSRETTGTESSSSIPTKTAEVSSTESARETTFAEDSSSQSLRETTPKDSSSQAKAEYLMKLLDKRKHLLSQLIQLEPAPLVDRKVDVTDQPRSSDSCPKTGGQLKCKNKDSVDTNIEKKHFGQGRSDSAQIPSVDNVRVVSGETDKKDVPARNKATCIIESTTKHSLVTSPPKCSTVTKLSVLDVICRHIVEWITPQTLNVLGKEDKGSVVSDSDDFKTKYARLCRRVDQGYAGSMPEETVIDPENPARPQKIPDVETLQKESEEFEIKVREFYKGNYTYKKSESDKEVDVRDDDSKETEVVLPIVDFHDQMLIRRKIVMEKLSRVLPEHLRPLKLYIQEVSTELKELITTFRLDSHNILLKPAEWSLVCLILLKLLSRRIVKLEEALKLESAVKHFTILLSGIGATMTDLDKQVVSLTEKGGS